MKVLAFAASNNRNSTNKKLVTYVAGLIKNATVEILDLNDFDMPMYSVDVEREIGQPEAAKTFLNKIAGADFILISFAEHNGNFTVAYHNIFDWAKNSLPHYGAVIYDSFSLPNFYQNFDDKSGITDIGLKQRIVSITSSIE
jgi:chromate reductase, NAD(P)H dehydrogenase (quinone)